LQVGNLGFRKPQSNIAVTNFIGGGGILMSLWVIFDRSSRFCQPVDVRFAPKATLNVATD
jgi:hypothetical protein